MRPGRRRDRRLGGHGAVARSLAVAVAVTAGIAGCSSGSTLGGSSSGTGGSGAPASAAGGSSSTAAGGAPSTAGNGKLTAKVTLGPSIGTFDSPTTMTARPGSTTLYVAEQPGRLRSVHVAANGAFSLDSALPLDLHDEVGSGGERGLLGLAFSPDGGKLYTYFTTRDGHLHLVEWTMDGERVVESSRRDLLDLPHDRPNHNGGQLQFGPDGYLYLGIGDGGGGGDPDHNGQNPGTLYGKILRIDPLHPGTGGTPYAIPPDNPFAHGGGAPEVWLYGARNPWRFSFDTNGDLWVGDVGQDAVEEIDHLPATDGRDAGKGANLGWNQLEGSRPYKDGTPPANSVLPVFEYTHDNGECSVIGGSVYRGKKIPNLVGVYLYGDYCIGDLRGLLTDGGTVVDEAKLGASVDMLTSFGVDDAGEQYAFSQGGQMFPILPA